MAIPTTDPASSTPATRTSQHFPLWLITDPHTPEARGWLVFGWERRGDLLAALVASEDQDMQEFTPSPLYIQDGDLFTTTPGGTGWEPQAPPDSYIIVTDGFQDVDVDFWAVRGWAWSGGNLEPVMSHYDADDLERLGMGMPFWSTKDTTGRRLEGYAKAWHWDAGQLIPECAVEDGDSLDSWDAIIRAWLPTLESTEA